MDGLPGVVSGRDQLIENGEFPIGVFTFTELVDKEEVEIKKGKKKVDVKIKLGVGFIKVV